MTPEELHTVISEHLEHPARYEVGKAVVATLRRAEGLAFVWGVMVGATIVALAVRFTS